jgi:hypothetical protein
MIPVTFGLTSPTTGGISIGGTYSGRVSYTVVAFFCPCQARLTVIERIMSRDEMQISLARDGILYHTKVRCVCTVAGQLLIVLFFGSYTAFEALLAYALELTLFLIRVKFVKCPKKYWLAMTDFRAILCTARSNTVLYPVNE